MKTKLIPTQQFLLLTALLTLPSNRFEKSINARGPARKSRSVVLAARLETKAHLVDDFVPIIAEIAHQLIRRRLFH